MAKMFAGKETKAEEMAEAKALKSGKISKAQYIKGEKAEGEKSSEAKKNADMIKSGKMSANQYAAAEKPMKKMADGGYCGVGYRSAQDYRK